MDALVTFLRARLDDDERIALGACWCNPADVPGVATWSVEATYHDAWPFMVFNELDDRVAQTCAENADNESVARHITVHDPARVLAEVEAKRQILDRCGWATETGGGSAFVLPVLRCLALPYAQHPDYREEWKP